MSTRKRGFIEIIGEIMIALHDNPLKKSHIAYKCNLDPRAVTKYLDLILHSNLVKKTEDLQHFMPTQKGIDFVNEYIKLTKFFENNLDED